MRCVSVLLQLFVCFCPCRTYRTTLSIWDDNKTDTHLNYTSSTTNAQTTSKQAFTKYNVAFQRVPPHTHRRDAAERAIQTWKAHFIAGLVTCDPSFPLSGWDRLITQCNLTNGWLYSFAIVDNIVSENYNYLFYYTIF